MAQFNYKAVDKNGKAKRVPLMQQTERKHRRN